MKLRWEELVVATPDVMGGEARFAGTRVPVHVVLACLSEGWDETRIHSEYPSLPMGAVRAAAGFSAWFLGEHADEAAGSVTSGAATQAG